MNTYHKIFNVFKRQTDGQPRKLIEGEYSRPEFKYLRHDKWIATEKIDGTNIRVMNVERKGIVFAGKTDKAKIPEKLFNVLDDMFDPDVLNEIFEGKEACLYGEGYGGRIQKAGPLYGDLNFILFDVKVGGIWLKRCDVESIARFLDINCVPVVGEMTLPSAVAYVKTGHKSLISDQPMEGLVLRPAVELRDRMGQRIITKIKATDF